MLTKIRRYNNDVEPDATYSKEEPVKSPYHSLQISIYGDIRDVTQAVGNMGMNDSNPPNKTGF